MTQPEDQTAKLKDLEQKVEAVSSTLKAVLTALVIRGILTKQAVAQILEETHAVVPDDKGTTHAEIDQIKQDLPTYMRAAMGPPPDEDDHDH